MPKIAYIEKRFAKSSLTIIEQANAIIADYAGQGFNLTLRQLYYQFVSRDLVANKQKEYKRIGSVINDGRLAGLIDWNAIEDRTRNLRGLSHWDNPAEIVDAAVNSYKRDKWENQPYRPEVWIEKDALTGVISGICNRLDVPFFSCRGYTSQSELWSAARRCRTWNTCDQKPFIIHLGDHDPSGIDMTRDITDRFSMFGAGTEVKRIALNMDQVDEFNPPPNPAKTTDSRYEMYIADYGSESWELDALEPKVIVDLIEKTVMVLWYPEKYYEYLER